MAASFFSSRGNGLTGLSPNARQALFQEHLRSMFCFKRSRRDNFEQAEKPSKKIFKTHLPAEKILRTNGIHTPMYGGRRYPLQAANAP